MADVTTFSSLTQQIEKRNFAPVYLLHGEEGFYIDTLVKMFEEALSPEERDFNFYSYYAAETSPDTVMDACRRYPMMSDYQVVIVRETQSGGANFLNGLKNYVANPSPTTILVISHRGAQAKGKDFMAAMKTGGGIVYESKKLTDRTIGPVIADLVKEKELNIEPKALEMLRDHIGTDLSRVHNEIEKLAVALPKGAMITPEAVEQNVGISKDYNNFELVAAVASRDFAKAMRIVAYFRRDPTNNPTMVVDTVLFNLFSNLLIVFYTPDKTDRSLMAALGFKSPYQLIDIKEAMRNYNAWQTIEIISEIRRFDAMTKGIGSRQDPYDLLDALIYRIMTARGKISLEA